MPTTGGYAPNPERYGTGHQLLQRLIAAIGHARGTGYDSTEGQTTVWAENYALARSLVAAWATTQRLANQFDPYRVTALSLSRWEKIFGLSPKPTADEATRRRALQIAWGRVGRAASIQNLKDLASTVLGVFYVDVIFLTTDQTSPYWPGAGNSTSVLPWYSTLPNILVHVVKPTGYTEAQFQDAMSSLFAVFDGLVPAWTTWYWYRDNTEGFVTTGFPQDTSAGFYLDTPFTPGGTPNLDNQIFDGIEGPPVVIIPLVSGHGLFALSRYTLSGVSALTFSGGASSIPLHQFTLTGTGSYTAAAPGPGGPFTGVGNFPLNRFTATGAGNLKFSGTGSFNLNRFTLNGSGSNGASSPPARPFLLLSGIY